ncbi:MAG: sugar ABC transporter permease [Eubacteriales bacterium]|nr:sugar ABC transporter permease [Eubacteriales bacterium]
MKKKLKAVIPICFVFPALLLLGFFVFYPLVENFINSLYNFSNFSPERTYVGLENIKKIFADSTVSVALLNNLRYALVSVVLQVFIALILAAVLEQRFMHKTASFYRIVYFMPVMISISVVALLFSFIYNPQMGILNSFLKAVGLGDLARPWLGRSDTAIYAVIAMSQWQSIGYIMLLFIVAIQKIPGDLYEAAQIDGANKIRTFFSVTVPQVKEAIFVNTLITIIGSMLVFSEPFILTKGGGPGISSITIAVHMYEEGFVKDNMGYASALAALIFVITAVVSLIQVIVSKTGKE